MAPTAATNPTDDMNDSEPVPRPVPEKEGSGKKGGKGKGNELKINNKRKLGEASSDRPEGSDAPKEDGASKPKQKPRFNHHKRAKGEDGKPLKRRSKKTRSKQKNIRKDTRPDHLKPKYRVVLERTVDGGNRTDHWVAAKRVNLNTGTTETATEGKA